MILLTQLLKKNELHMDRLILMLKNIEKILEPTNSSNLTRFGKLFPLKATFKINKRSLNINPSD